MSHAETRSEIPSTESKSAGLIQGRGEGKGARCQPSPKAGLIPWERFVFGLQTNQKTNQAGVGAPVGKPFVSKTQRLVPRMGLPARVYLPTRDWESADERETPPLRMGGECRRYGGTSIHASAPASRLPLPVAHAGGTRQTGVCRGMELRRRGCGAPPSPQTNRSTLDKPRG